MSAEGGAWFRYPCVQCGDTHPHNDCAWLKQCAECLRTGAEMLKPRLCVDCAESLECAARRAKAHDDYEAYGDHLRDMQKGES